MERIGRSLAKLKLADSVSQDDLACAAWSAAVGPRLARYAWARALVRGTLIVDVEDAIWQKQLFHLRLHILGKLIGILGDGIVRDLEFRVATPRRPPQPAQSLSETKSSDEADRIEHPTLRMIYKQARKKASA